MARQKNITNRHIARLLKEYADLLAIKGESRFRVGAYRKASQTIEGLSQPVAQLGDGGADLSQLPGIGTSMADHVREIVETDRLAALSRLHEELPRTLVELMQLEGLGPKKTRQLYGELGVSSMAELTAALDSGEVEQLRGFGQKTAENLRRAITESAQLSKRFKLAEADQLIQPLLAYLRQAPGIEKLEIAGSYRRRRETVGDIDLLGACEQTQKVMKYAQAYPQLERVEQAGTTRGTLVLQSGLRVDVRLVPRRSYGAALHYFSGSQAHNVAVRKLGVERGLRINEYGIFRPAKGKQADKKGGSAGQRVGGTEEAEVFQAVSMAWVPPELREDRGEVQAAQQNTLPNLITLDDIRGNLHMHTTWTDGNQSIEEMARACQEQGYEYCAITDHSQSTRVAGGLDRKRLKKQAEEIKAVRQHLEGIRLLSGVEVDILPDGSLDLPDNMLDGLDIVVASVHSRLHMSQQQMTKRILSALSHPAVDILAHPTARRIHKRSPIAVDLEAVLQTAKENEVAVELNAQPDRLDLNDVQVHRAQEIGVKIAINSDAHSIDNLQCMRFGIDQARRGWLEAKDVLNTRRWAQFRAWLNRRRH